MCGARRSFPQECRAARAAVRACLRASVDVRAACALA